MKISGLRKRTWLAAIMRLFFAVSGVFFIGPFETSVRAFEYDFNSLTNGNLNGQDSWETTLNGTAVDVQVENFGNDGTKAMKFTQSGGGINATAFNESLALPPFTETHYVAEFDIYPVCWGASFGIGTDVNGNGSLDAGIGERGVDIFINTGCGGIKRDLRLCDGSTASNTSVTLGSWNRIRISIDLSANSGQGSGSVYFKNLTNGDTSWSQISGLQNVNLKLDSSRTAADSSNPENWNAVSSFLSGNPGAIDNIIVTQKNLVVDNSTDTLDGNTGAGNNTLRDAIYCADAGDTITFDSGIAGSTITLDSSLGQLTIDKNLTIDGESNNITVSGNNAVRVFDVTAGTVTFKSLTIADGNGGTGGGGILAGTGTSVTVSGCTVKDNTATSGGAIRLAGATLVAGDSTFSGNSAQWGGAVQFSGNGTITNCTFPGNTASSGGGAVNSNPTNVVTLKNCTISGNAPHGIRTHSGTYNLENTIIANHATDCLLTNGGDVGTNTNNLIEDGSCSDGATGMVTGDPMLGPLTIDNGGNAPTMALPEGSPAVNAGDSGTAFSTDQRGYFRNDGSPDIGAFEYHGGYPIVTTATPSEVSTTEFSGSGNIASVGDENATERGICWDTDPAPDNTDSNDEETGGDFGTGNFAATLTPLIPGETYYARAYATNLRGTAYGDEVSFTTPMTPPGNALSFDGTNDYVQMNDFDIGISDFTMEVWIKNNLGGSTESVITNRTSEGNATGNWFAFDVVSDKLRFFMAAGGAASSWKETGNNTLSNGWNHLAVVRNSTTVTYYVNGFQDSQFTGVDLRNLTAAFGIARLGGWVNYGEFWFSGITDEVRIWNIARSEAQIQADMHTELTGGETGLVAYYNFNHISGTTLADLTSGNHGTLHNGPSYEVSGAIVGDIETAYQNDVNGIWDTSTESLTGNGLSLSSVSLDDYLVFGHDNASGTTGDDAPAGDSASLTDMADRRERNSFRRHDL